MMVYFDSDCISSKIFMGESYNDDIVIFDIENKEYKTYKKEKDLSPWLVIGDKILCKSGNKSELLLYTGLFELL